MSSSIVISIDYRRLFLRFIAKNSNIRPSGHRGGGSVTRGQEFIFNVHYSFLDIQDLFEAFFNALQV